MTARRPRTGNLLALRADTGEEVDKFPAGRFPVQHEIQQLQKELNDFNERIIELENVGHRGHAGTGIFHERQDVMHSSSAKLRIMAFAGSSQVTNERAKQDTPKAP